MKKLILLFMLSIILSNCSSNDDSDSDLFENPSGSYLRANVNGENFVTNGVLDGVSAQLTESSSIFAFALSAAVYDGNSFIRTVSFGIGGGDSGAFTNNFEVTSTDEGFTVLCYYIEANANGDSTGGVSEDNAYIKITSIDRVNKIISGEFNFVAIDTNNPNLNYVVTDGVFNEIEYTTEED